MKASPGWQKVLETPQLVKAEMDKDWVAGAGSRQGPWVKGGRCFCHLTVGLPPGIVDLCTLLSGAQPPPSTLCVLGHPGI